MIDTPQRLSLALSVTSLSFTTAHKDLPLQPQLLLSQLGSALQLQWPPFVYRSQKAWFHYHRAFAPSTPTAQMASLPMLPPFYHFLHFSVFIISILAQMSLPQHLLYLKLPPFSILLVISFHLTTCKMILFMSSFTCLFSNQMRAL